MSASATVYWEWIDCATRTKHHLKRRARIVAARNGRVAFEVPGTIPLDRVHRVYYQVQINYPWKKRWVRGPVLEWPT